MNSMLKTDRPLKLGINQNVIIFIVSIFALGVSEYFNLKMTLGFSWVVCLMASVSLFFTISAYTYRQCVDKIVGKAK